MKNTRQKGFVLLVTVIIIAAITAVIIAYSKRISTAYNSVDQGLRDTNLRNTAQSGLNFALAYLNNIKKQPGISTLNTSFDDIECNIRIECQNGRININNLVNNSGNFDKQYAELVLRLIDDYNEVLPVGKKISYGLVPAVIDAIDSNNETCELDFISRDNTGAEKSYYTDARLPGILNSPLEQVTDVFFLRNCPADTLTAQPNDNTIPLTNCLTTAKTKKIDINSAPAEVIAALSDKITIEQARNLTVAEKIDGYATLEDFYKAAQADLSGMTSLLETQPADRIFTITVTAKSGYKTIKLIAQAQKDDNDRYNGKKMYCN